MKDVQHLAAELALLHEYDAVRQAKGYDFGCGQRGAELIRRRRELELELKLAGPSSADIYALERSVTRAELLAAFQRIGKSRLRRAERDAAVYHTPSAIRTRLAWKQIGRWVGASV